MATVHLANVDDEGNFLSPKIIARLEEKFGTAGTGGTTGGITGSTTLDQAAAQNGA